MSRAPDTAYAAVLCGLPGMTPQRIRALLHGREGTAAFEEVRSSSPEVVRRLCELPSFAGGIARRRDSQGQLVTPELVAERWAARCARIDVSAVWESWKAAGIGVARLGDDGFPKRLGANLDDDPPEVLFFRGDPSVADGPAVAIVGTRKATHYGEEVAAELGVDLASCGVCVVSGLALGIDGAAHEGALRGCHPEGARPMGVLGGGVDVPYPQRNAGLIRRVAESGCVVSEAPPGAPPESWRFPMRNRIIATLAQVLVVVESPRQGGAMHTVDAASARGRELFAVPGSVRSLASEGTNELLVAGVQLCRDADDVLVALEAACSAEGLDPPSGSCRDSGRQSSGSARRQLDAKVVAARLSACSSEERAVHAALDDHPATSDAICRRCGLGVGAAALALDRLGALGLAEHVVGGWRKL